MTPTSDSDDLAAAAPFYLQFDQAAADGESAHDGLPTKPCRRAQTRSYQDRPGLNRSRVGHEAERGGPWRGHHVSTLKAMSTASTMESTYSRVMGLG